LGGEYLVKYIKDEHGKDLLFDEDYNYQTMMEWEKPYMDAIIENLSPSGDVLEIGFGLGYSANKIQSFNINSHTIIECDENVYQRALKWKENYNHTINIIFEKWENIYQTLPKFDCIFFDDYDIETLELCKVEISTPCRNIDFIKKIKNNLKDYSRFSFYCALNKKNIKNYEIQWIHTLKNYWKNVDFQEYEINVSENCRYIVDQSLYCPLIEIKKIFNYN
jgi:hypothetical protein